MARVLRQRPGFDDIAIIFLSGRVETREIEAGRRMGAVYLTKPFIASALLNAIDRLTTVTEASW